MNGNELWIGLAVGLLPYHIERRWRAHGTRQMEIRALFWSLVARRHRNGCCSWRVRAPLIERLRDAAWAAIERLRK